MKNPENNKNIIKIAFSRFHFRVESVYFLHLTDKKMV